MARKKKEPAPPAEREYKVIITSDATVRLTYRLMAASPEAALRMAVSGEYEPTDEQVDNGRDVYAEVDGKEMDLET